MDTLRTVYRIDRDHPGSDVAGETAAALAAASIVFRSRDPGYSRLLLDRAIEVFISVLLLASAHRHPFAFIVVAHDVHPQCMYMYASACACTCTCMHGHVWVIHNNKLFMARHG